MIARTPPQSPREWGEGTRGLRRPETLGTPFLRDLTQGVPPAAASESQPG